MSTVAMTELLDDHVIQKHVNCSDDLLDDHVIQKHVAMTCWMIM